MRIAIDATAIGSTLGGDETWVRSLLDGLAAAASHDDSFPLLLRPEADLPDTIAADGRFIRVALHRRRGLLHYGVGLPRAVAALSPRPDAACSITHAGLVRRVRWVLTIGDLSFRHFPEHYPRAARLRLEALVPRQVRAVAAVLVPSEFSRRDLVETFDLDPTRVHVVPNRVVDRGPLPEDRRAAADANLVAAGVRDPFVLYLGNLHPRKNVGRLVDAFIQLSGAVPDARLVIAGGQWWKGGDERARAARASRGSIVFLGRVDDDVRRRLLERATLLAYPSMFEGFGLPPLEAMAAGTPVVSSDATAIPEVCGDAALLVDPTDVDAIADAMGRVLQDEDLRRQLRERGRARAATFDAARTGAAAMRAFADALAVAT